MPNKLLLFVYIFSFASLSSNCTERKSRNLPSKYLEEVLDLLEAKSVNKNKIDWKAFRKDVSDSAQNSRTIEDTYPAVRYAVAKLGDNHSYFSPATKVQETQEEKPLPVLKDETVPSDIGYVRIPFCIGNREQTDIYIRSVSDKILRQNNKNVKGWVIDLRDNFGGNMWPMMAALGPLLETGTQGYFFYADNKFTEWHYEGGKACMETNVLAENKDTVSVYGKNKIAVLVNGKTASSGEAIAVLFKGYAHTKFFGEPTFGVSTGCESFTLSDGSRINLATSVFADRNKNRFGNAIAPDTYCTDGETLPKAIEWIYD